MKERVWLPPPPRGLTLQGGHHGFAQSQHQAQRGAKEEEAGDLEVKAGSAGGAVRSLRSGSRWAGGCACPPGLPRGGGWGGCLQAVGGGGVLSAASSTAQHKPRAWVMGQKCHLL